MTHTNHSYSRQMHVEKGLRCSSFTEWSASVLCIQGPAWVTKNYVAIELEALAVSWAIEKFHHYLYGHTFTLQTDQKPLVSILGHSLLEASKTMQRLLMKTIAYHFDVEYIKGSTNVIADCLSHAPITTDSIHLPIMQINLVTQSLRCTPDKMQWL